MLIKKNKSTASCAQQSFIFHDQDVPIEENDIDYDDMVRHRFCFWFSSSTCLANHSYSGITFLIYISRFLLIMWLIRSEYTLAVRVVVLYIVPLQLRFHHAAQSMPALTI